MRQFLCGFMRSLLLCSCWGMMSIHKRRRRDGASTMSASSQQQLGDRACCARLCGASISRALSVDSKMWAKLIAPNEHLPRLTTGPEQTGGDGEPKPGARHINTETSFVCNPVSLSLPPPSSPNLPHQCTPLFLLLQYTGVR